MTSGRYDPIVHLGSYPARDAADLVAARARMMLDEGVTPTIETLQRHRVTTRRLVISDAREAWLASLVDLEPATVATYTAVSRHAERGFRGRDVRAITTDEVQAWLVGLADGGVEPRALPKYRRALAQILDHAGVEPNPVRDRRVRNPRADQAEFRLPSRAELAKLYPRLDDDTHIALVLLEHSGLRISEATMLRWEDRDGRRARFRVASGKTPSARRWVDDLPEYPPELVALLDTPASSRGTSRYVLGGRNSDAIAAALARGCVRAKVRHFSPHDFRHLHISRLMHAGWDPIMVAARVGHSRPATTLNVYAHVLPPD
jgi:integrase